MLGSAAPPRSTQSIEPQAMSPQTRTILVCVVVIVAINVGIFAALKKIRNARHSIEGEVQVFRYTAIVAWAYILGPPLLGIVGYLLAYGPTLSPSVESKSAMAVAILSACLLMLVGLWYRSFSITVSGSTICIRSIFRTTTAQFSDLEKILVTGSPAKTLVVIDKTGKRVFSAYDDLQDFADLIYLLKSNSAQYNVEARIKDQWGRWSEL
jgi:hypothetical protein